MKQQTCNIREAREWRGYRVKLCRPFCGPRELSSPGLSTSPADFKTRPSGAVAVETKTKVEDEI